MGGTGKWRLEDRCVAHEGATGTSYAAAGYFPELDLGFVALANVNLFDPMLDDGEVLMEGVMDVLTGREPDLGMALGRLERSGFGILLVVTLGGLVHVVWKWWRVRSRGEWPWTRGRAARLVAELAVPVVMWFGLLKWTKITLSGFLAVLPDVAVAAPAMTGAGMLTAVVRFAAPGVVDGKEDAAGEPDA